MADEARVQLSELSSIESVNPVDTRVDTWFTTDMTNNHWIYFTKHPSGTVHLANFDDVARGPRPRPKTLCGRLYTDVLTEGDETVSGHAATCGICRKAARGVGAGHVYAPAGNTGRPE